MTPEEVLEEVKTRFVVLYHKDDEELHRLLRRALLKFQDKAGAITEIWTTEQGIVCPDDMKAPASCCDAKRRYIPYRWDTKEKTVEFVISSKHESPYCFMYFLDLQHWPLDQDLPHDVSSIVADYLEALIALPNTLRQKETYLLLDMSSAAQELPSQTELKQNIDLVEQLMEEKKAIILPHSYF